MAIQLTIRDNKIKPAVFDMVQSLPSAHSHISLYHSSSHGSMWRTSNETNKKQKIKCQARKLAWKFYYHYWSHRKAINAHYAWPSVKDHNIQTMMHLIGSLQIQPSLLVLCYQGRFAGQTSVSQRLKLVKCHTNDVKSVQNLDRSSDWLM